MQTGMQQAHRLGRNPHDDGCYADGARVAVRKA
jgi:hypothetical protein